MAGHFMTSLDMAGLQIMIMHLNDQRRKALGNVIHAFLLKQVKKTHIVVATRAMLKTTYKNKRNATCNSKQIIIAKITQSIFLFLLFQYA